MAIAPEGDLRIILSMEFGASYTGTRIGITSSLSIQFFELFFLSTLPSGQRSELCFGALWKLYPKRRSAIVGWIVSLKILPNPSSFTAAQGGGVLLLGCWTDCKIPFLARSHLQVQSVSIRYSSWLDGEKNGRRRDGQNVGNFSIFLRAISELNSTKIFFKRIRVELCVEFIDYFIWVMFTVW